MVSEVSRSAWSINKVSTWGRQNYDLCTTRCRDPIVPSCPSHCPTTLNAAHPSSRNVENRATLSTSFPRPRDADIASDSARRPTSRDIADIASDMPAITRHRYDRRSWRRGLTPTSPLRHDGSRSSRDMRDATVQHLLSYDICCLLKI